MLVLITGGAGYIGSHTALALLRNGHDIVLVDDLSNGSRTAVERVGDLAGRSVRFHQLDLRHVDRLREVFVEQPVDAVIHFAGLKSIGESVADPVRYYDVNVGATVALCRVMRENGVRRLVFSSSATVYGDAAGASVDESVPMSPVNPYGRTKSVIEHILSDLVATADDWQITKLRYFNPVGADRSGRIGEDPLGRPNNLLPYVAQVAVGRLAELTVFGDDYSTVDGTGVRDYVHVSDLADGHLAALANMPARNSWAVYNLGTGRGHSVLEVVSAFARASGVRIPYRIGPRRAGDVGECWANPARAERGLFWHATRGLDEICADAWRWQSQNPHGYAD